MGTSQADFLLADGRIETISQIGNQKSGIENPLAFIQPVLPFVQENGRLKESSDKQAAFALGFVQC